MGDEDDVIRIWYHNKLTEINVNSTELNRDNIEPMYYVISLCLESITAKLDELCGACLDGDKVIAPDKKTLMSARSVLPSKYKNTLTKK